ncbi:MAG: glycoside hydrolase family 43 protein [Planctomycetota bacterium]
MSTTFTNPVVPGCYPDPSVCRIGAWYYLACSSFHYWPGLPLFRSRDLVHWQSIGHAVDRPEQMDLRTIAASEGLFAPTLRYHDGRFRLLCTRVAGPRDQWRNFILEAEDPTGDWSDPIWIEPPAGVDPGIDPSIAWDEDGRCWLHGNRRRSDGGREIWLQEWDERDRTLLGAPTVLTRGSCGHGVEGPHLYQHDGRWYLLTAEGGTGPWHAVACYRSEAITGPYRACPLNPLLTHRHLGADMPIVNPGHADLVQAPDGSWAALLLASRQVAPGFTPLGRETWLVDVRWEDGWPVFRPGDGQVRARQVVSWPLESARSAASSSTPADGRWHGLRTPAPDSVVWTDRGLRLRTGPDAPLPVHLLHRCTAADWSCTIRLPEHGSGLGAVGILAVHNDVCQLRVLCRAVGDAMRLHIERRDRAGVQMLLDVPWPAGEEWLRLSAQGSSAAVATSPDGRLWSTRQTALSLAHLTPSAAWGFVGTSVGCMAEAAVPLDCTVPVCIYQDGHGAAGPDGGSPAE